MKVYLYLHPGQLDVLRYARLHFTSVSAQADPYQNNAKAITRRAIRVSEADFQQEIQRQFRQLPEHLRSLMPWATFQQEATKKRSQIEAQMRSSKQSKPVQLPNPAAYANLAGISFCARPDNPLAWDRWADQHRGLVLELDTSYPGFNSSQQVLKPVVYSSQRPAADHPVKPFPALFVRPPEYASEEEVRLLRPKAAAKKVQQLKNGAQVYLFPFPPRALLGVTFGANASAAIREQVSNILRYDLKYKPGRSVREILLDPESFTLHQRGTL